MLTVQELEKALPANSKALATTTLVNTINGIVTDPEVRDTYKKNVLGFAAVLQNPNVSMEDYLNAVAFVGYKHMGHTDEISWSLVFSQKYASLVAAGVKEQTIKGYVRAYVKNPTYIHILNQSYIPLYLANMDVQQKAVNQLAELMMTSTSDMVRMKAADSLLAHLAKPTEAVTAITINTGQTDGMNELRETMEQMAREQQAYIKSGGSTAKAMASQTIVDVEVK